MRVKDCCLVGHMIFLCLFHIANHRVFRPIPTHSQNPHLCMRYYHMSIHRFIYTLLLARCYSFIYIFYMHASSYILENHRECVWSIWWSFKHVVVAAVVAATSPPSHHHHHLVSARAQSSSVCLCVHAAAQYIYLRWVLLSKYRIKTVRPATIIVATVYSGRGYANS